ncbi:MAG: protein kinase [Ktedonobacterales bacterium]|nr:protein kinase [Ktedonobacterales bacterium]
MMGAQGPGRMLGAYQLGPFLGAGPVGDVFRARTGTEPRELAVKVLRPPLANSPQVRQKFAAIAAIVATLDHPHVLPLDYFGEQGNQIFGVTPLVAQGSLLARLNNGRLSPKDVAPLFSQVCDALHYLSEHGMVHGNLKPTNILLFEGRHCMLGDFGQLWQVSEVDLTQSGISAEATFYMAPEQMEGFVDARSDIYSLGAILFHALTGQPPFPGQTPFEVLSRHNRQPVPSLRTLNGPVAEGALAFDEVLRIALAKNPAERFQSPVAMARAIVEAGNLANDLPSRAMPVVRPGQMPPGVVSPVPSRPNPAYGPMPGQMMPPRPNNMPYGAPMLPPPMGPAGVPLFPGQVPPPGAAPNSRPRVPSQPLPPQARPPMGAPGQDQSLQWLIPDSQPAAPPPARGTPQPPNLDAANFQTARHSADMVDRILAGEESGIVAPPTIETGSAARPRRDDWWEGDDSRDYTDRSAIYDERDVRDWDDSRSVSVPSMRTPSRPASRDRWAESDDRYRRDDTSYSREMESERVPARGRPYDATGRNATPDAQRMGGRMASAEDRGRPSVVIPASKNTKKRRSRLPAILAAIIFVVLLVNVGLLSVAAPQYCPAHLCDGLHSRLAPLFGIKSTSAARVTAALTKPDTTFKVAVAGTNTTAKAITLTSDSTTTWTATVDLAWVTVAPVSGSLSATAPSTLDVTLTPDVTVIAGTYSATVTITAGGQTTQIKLPIVVGG